MSRLFLLLFSLFTMIAFAASAFGQLPHTDNNMDHHSQHQPRWGRMSANVENLRMLKMLEAVDLTEEQSGKFLPLFHGFRKDIKTLRQERKELVEGIIHLVHQEGGDDKIKADLAKLKANRQQIDRRQEKFLSDCENVLTTPQLARLIVFQEHFERDMLESLREFRQQKGPHSQRNRKGKI
jgi:Spy/CpxP family protein refolding chaperone